MQFRMLRRYVAPMVKINRFLGIAALLVLLGGTFPLFAQPAPVSILVLGDSLTAGYGLAPEEAFPVKLEQRLKKEGRNVRVLNGGVSGDTSAGGRARLDWALADKSDAVIVELGANDGLRGLEPAQMKDNLDAIIAALKKRNIAVLLAGMRAPPNFGPRYGAEFDAVYPSLAKKHAVPLYPFFLDGVAAEPALNQRDGIHPNRDGVRVIVDRITSYVLRLLDSLKEE